MNFFGPLWLLVLFMIVISNGGLGSFMGLDPEGVMVVFGVWIYSPFGGFFPFDLLEWLSLMGLEKLNLYFQTLRLENWMEVIFTMVENSRDEFDRKRPRDSMTHEWKCDDFMIYT